MKKILLIILSVSASSQLLGVLKTTVKNNSKKNIEVMGYGLGCAGVVLGRGLMCDVKPVVIKPGESAQVPYQKKIIATPGGIIVQADENGAQYEIKAESKLGNLEFSVEQPGPFKQISRDLKAVVDKVVPQLTKVRQEKQFYFVLFANNKDGKITVMAEGPMPLDGKLKVGVDDNFVPMFQLEQYQSSNPETNQDIYKVTGKSDNFPTQ